MHLSWLWHRWAWEYRALGRRGSRAWGGSRPGWVALALAAPNPRWGCGLRPPGVTVCCRLPVGSRESLFSCALTASEEAMAALEEVILHAFQQCVYYVSKVRRAAGSLPRGGGCSLWRPSGLGVGRREGDGFSSHHCLRIWGSNGCLCALEGRLRAPQPPARIALVLEAAGRAGPVVLEALGSDLEGGAWPLWALVAIAVSREGVGASGCGEGASRWREEGGPCGRWS